VGATEVTTGTFVVWRNMRVSRVIRHEVGAAPDAKLTGEAAAAPYNMSTVQYLRRAAAHDGTNHLGLGTVRLDDPDGGGSSPFTSLPLHYAPGYLEVEFDTAAPESLTDAEFKKARKQGVDDAKGGQASKGLANLDLEALYYLDADFAANASVATMVMRSPESYNAKVPAAKRIPFSGGAINTAKKDKIVELTEEYAINGFMRHITRDGALPGITLIYSGMGHTWQLLLGGDYSGRVLDYRGSYLWYGARPYTIGLWTNGGNFPYDCSSNGCHELGHAMFQPHGVAGNAGGPNSARHDPEADCFCVMSYGRSNGQYCGLTLLSFRGWNVPQPPA
jgi:hypothetical protein